MTSRVVLPFVLAASLARGAAAEVAIEKVSCLDLPGCYRLQNGTVEVVVTTDVGPRIVSYRFAAGENVLRQRVQPGPKTQWKSYGGHRLWAAPEQRPRTYFPDNDPVEHAEDAAAGAIRLTAPVETANGIQKTIRVVLDREGSGVTVEHEIANRGSWPVELAPWAVTVMEGGGSAIVPQEPPSDGLLPVRSIALWGYTAMDDARLTFGRRFVRIRSDPAIPRPLKIGFGNARGWAAYHRAGTLFVKRFPHEAGAAYPDLGSNNEIYTNGAMLEVETVAPLRRLEPGAVATHVERWSLHRDFALPEGDDDLAAALERVLTP